MRLLLIIPCLMLCVGCLEDVKSIVKDIDDHQIVEKTDQAIVYTSSTFSNLTVITTALNVSLPVTMSKLNTTLDNASQLAISFDATSKQIGKAAEVLQTSLPETLTKINTLSDSINQQVPETFSNLNAMAKNTNILITNLNNAVVRMDHLLQGQNASGQEASWMKNIKSFGKPILIAVLIGVILFSVTLIAILGRMLWITTKSIDASIPPVVKTDLGTIQREKAPFTQVLISKWLKVQRRK